VVATQEVDTDGFVSQGCGNGLTCDPASQAGACTAAAVAAYTGAQGTTFSPFRAYSYAELSAATGSTMVGRCSLTVSKSVLKAPMVAALETIIS